VFIISLRVLYLSSYTYDLLLLIDLLLYDLFNPNYCTKDLQLCSLLQHMSTPLDLCRITAALSYISIIPNYVLASVVK